MALFDKEDVNRKKTQSPPSMWRYFTPLLIYMLIENLVSVVVIVAVNLQKGFSEVMTYQTTAELYDAMTKNLVENMDQIQFYTVALTYLVLIPVLVRMMKKDHRQAVMEEREIDRSFAKQIRGMWYLLIPLAGFCYCLAGSNMIDMTGLVAMSEGYQKAVDVLYSADLPMEILVVGIISPVAEELLFRGIVYNRLHEYSSFLSAAIWSALMFAVLHENLVQGVYAFLFGMLACYLYERYGTILAPIIMHVAANLLATVSTETSILRFAYSTDMGMYLSTFVCLLILAIVLYMIECYVRPYSEGEA